MASTVLDRGPVVLAVTIAMIAASSFFVMLRFVSRIGVVGRVTWDDYTILIAWFISFGFSFSICWGTHVGLGLHEQDIPLQHQVALKKANYAFSVLYNPALMATKTSILIFYFRLCKEEKIFRCLSWFTLFVTNAAGLLLTFFNIFQCRPVTDTFKNQSPDSASCTNIVTLYLASAPVNIITDLAILFLPMPILTGMRLPRKQKIILVITFSFGAFVAVVDVVRIAYLQNASLARLQKARASDFAWYASLSFMWSAVEVNVGIICACVPSLKPLVSRILPSMIRDSNGDNEKSIDSAGMVHPDIAVPLTRARVPSFVNGALHNPTPPPPRTVRPKDDVGQIGFIDFLSSYTDTPMNRTQTAATTRATAERGGFTDFVDLKKPHNMLELSNKEAIMPLALTTILFFLWGFAYGLLDALNSQFQRIVKMTNGQHIGLHSAYFGGYFLGPLTFGQFVLKYFGFKATFICGLCIYGTGTLVFWPSAVLTSFTAFLFSNLIVGIGLSTLETAANPFIALCGPPAYAEIRLNISQGFQAIGTVVSPLLAQKVFFKNASAPSLIDIQWAYLGIALFVVLLALVFHYMPIPEATDDGLDELAGQRRDINQKRVFGVSVVWVTLGLGIFSQFCYVGGQESVSVQFQDLVKTVKPNARLSPLDYQTIGHTVFAVGRFMSAVAGWFFKPRWILLFLYIGLVITSILEMNLTGYASISMAVLEYVFMSGAFSIIFAISLRGCGRYTKTASVFLTAAISGGAVIPAIQSAVITRRRSMQYSFCVVTAVFAFGAIFPAYLNLVPAAKMQTDPVLGGHHSRGSGVAGKKLGNLSQEDDRGHSNSPDIEHAEDRSAAGPSEPRLQTRNLTLHPSDEPDLPDRERWPT